MKLSVPFCDHLGHWKLILYLEGYFTIKKHLLPWTLGSSESRAQQSTQVQTMTWWGIVISSQSWHDPDTLLKGWSNYNGDVVFSKAVVLHGGSTAL